MKTYSKLFLQSNTFSKGRHKFLAETSVATEVERLKLFKVSKVFENGAESIFIEYLVVFKGHCYHVFSLLKVRHYLSRLVLINDAVLGNVAHATYKFENG